MKRMFPYPAVTAFLLLFCANISFVPPESNDEVDVISYQIEASIHDDRIEESVILRAVGKKPVKELLLELSGDLDVLSCSMGEKDIPYERSGWKLTLDMAKVGSPKGEFSILFEVKGKPYIKFSEKRGGFVRTVVSPEHAYIRSQYAWYPRHEDDPALYDTTLKVRNDWQVRTAGELEEKRGEGDWNVWHYLLHHPDRRIGLSAGDYRFVEKKSKSGAVIDAMVFPGHEEGARALVEMALKAMEYYSTLYGPLGMKRFTLVEMPEAFGKGSGYGETGYVLIGTGAFEDGGSASWAESLVAHEVSHSWWGHEVGFRHFASEMFATYTTHRYMEGSLGMDAARTERSSFVRQLVSVARKIDEVDLKEIKNWGSRMDPSVYRVHAYEKGAMLLHLLECEMGRDALDAAMKKFIHAHRGTMVDYNTVCKDLAGSKWRWLFSQWGGEGIPRLWEEHETKASRSSFNVKGKLFQEGTKKPFRMAVTLRATAGDKTFDHQVKVKKTETAFKFTCPFEPEEIIIDPESHLIYESAAAANQEELANRIFEVANDPGMLDEERLEMTLKDIRKVISASGEDISHFYTALGRCLFRLERFDEAKDAFETALDGGAGGPFHRQWVYLRLGCIEDLKKRRSQAERFYKKATEIKKNGSKTANNQALLFLQRPFMGTHIELLASQVFKVVNNPNEADKRKLGQTVKEIQQVMDAGIKDSVYHTALGRCYFRMGKFKEAKAEFETALKGGAGGPFHRQWAYLRLGCMADLKKKRPEAESYYKKAMEIARNGSEFTMKKAELFLERPYRGHDQDR